MGSPKASVRARICTIKIRTNQNTIKLIDTSDLFAIRPRDKKISSMAAMATDKFRIMPVLLV